MSSYPLSCFPLSPYARISLCASREMAEVTAEGLKNVLSNFSWLLERVRQMVARVSPPSAPVCASAVADTSTGTSSGTPTQTDCVSATSGISNLSKCVGRVVCVLGSGSDVPLANTIKRSLASWDVPCEVRVASAHKAPEYLLRLLDEYHCMLFYARWPPPSFIARILNSFTDTPLTPITPRFGIFPCFFISCE